VTVFVARRVLWTIPTLLVAVLIAFLMVRAIGGNPFIDGPIGLPGNTPETFQPEVLPEALEEKYHFNDPWYVHYLRYVGGIFTFDFGPSTQFPNREVSAIIAAQAPRSLLLGSLALAWALVVGLPAGVLAALRANSWPDYVLTAFASVSLALPNFLVGTLLIYLVSVRFGLLPTNGWGTWKHTVMPSLALGLMPLGYVIRIVRGTMLETLAQDYVRAARAKGLTRGRLVLAHVVRNSLVPAVTAAGPMLGLIIAGAFVIENIFSIAGIGRYFVVAVQARDDGVVMGLTVVITLTIIVGNLVVDVVYALLDPRLRDRR
jgi:ABC-type dipeptide/oligopeptide/nickel transport system permease component